MLAYLTIYGFYISTIVCAVHAGWHEVCTINAFATKVVSPLRLKIGEILSFNKFFNH